MPVIVGFEKHDLHGGPPNVTQADAGALVEGVLVGMNSSGEVVVAGSNGAPAYGFLRAGAWEKDWRGGNLRRKAMVEWVDRGRVGGFSGLTPGRYYYLHTGGLVTGGMPGTGALGQTVGRAVDTTTMIIAIGTPSVIA